MPRSLRSRPLTRLQRRENRAFVIALSKCGNLRLAAREVGVAYGTFQHRRARCAAFAQDVAAAMAVAQARLATDGPKRPTRGAVGRGVAGGAGGGAGAGAGAGAGGAGDPHRTVGGETVVVRGRDGRLQVRRAQPGKLTHDCEQAFLSALSATANVRLAAAAAGASVAAFYRRRRRDEAFAREFGLALTEGYERLELALLASAQPDHFARDDWRRNDRPEMPPLTPNQALQLMYLHQKEARLDGTPPHLRTIPGESRAVRAERLRLLGEHRQERERMAFRIAEAERLARGERTHFDWAPGELPDLSQVTGWSTASGRAGVDEGTALFGGWRMAHLKARGG